MKKTDNITIETIVVRDDAKFIISPLGNELVMMSIENGTYIGINEVGTTIWNYLDKPQSVKDLINYLLSVYDISEAECTMKTIKHLHDMLEAGMLIIAAK